jgi:hypothetical protein
MDAALQEAIDSLKIRDVYLYSSSALLEDAFEPKYDPDLDKLEVQFKHAVTRSNVLELEEGNKTINLFRVYVELGTRWVLPNLVQDSDSDPEIKAHIEGVMVAEYLMRSDPGPDALKQFAMKNASFHIWPYWREYLTSHCQRMNLPKLIMPAVQFASNQGAD